MHDPVERVGVVYEEVHGSHSLNGIGVCHRLLHDQTCCTPVEIISVFKHIEERTSGLGRLLQDQSHPRAVAAGVGAASVIAEEEHYITVQYSTVQYSTVQ